MVSKIIEKVITTKLLFNEKQHYLQIPIWIFKESLIDTSLSYLMDKIVTGFDSGLLTRMILIDLQKAFDAINHVMLLIKSLL